MKNTPDAKNIGHRDIGVPDQELQPLYQTQSELAAIQQRLNDLKQEKERNQQKHGYSDISCTKKHIENAFTFSSCAEPDDDESDTKDIEFSNSNNAKTEHIPKYAENTMTVSK